MKEAAGVVFDARMTGEPAIPQNAGGTYGCQADPVFFTGEQHGQLYRCGQAAVYLRARPGQGDGQAGKRTGRAALRAQALGRDADPGGADAGALCAALRPPIRADRQQCPQGGGAARDARGGLHDLGHAQLLSAQFSLAVCALQPGCVAEHAQLFLAGAQKRPA